MLAGTLTRQAARTTAVCSRRCMLRRSSHTTATADMGDNTGPRPLHLGHLKFDNSSLAELPVETKDENHVRKVAGAVWARVKPTPVSNPHTIEISQPALSAIGVEVPDAAEGKEELYSEVAEYFGGNSLLPGSDPAAHCYAGHQFGSFSGQLGDGRAITLGEVVNNLGERWELQLKGAGLTPFSRTADGRAVLRSSIREFLCSEHMWALGIPTTRAASLVTSDTLVMRDPLYNGNPIQEKASIVLRMAPSFLRLGSWEVWKPTDPRTGRSGPSAHSEHYPMAKQLTDYAIKMYYPHLVEKFPDDQKQRYIAFFDEVVVRTARLVAHWQCVGFVHGVLNTDNLSVLGLTIDYGPFGFLDRYDPGFIPNHSDDSGRYSYRNQPGVCKWNLLKFAEGLSHTDLVEEDVLKQRVRDLYDAEFHSTYMSNMRRKLGLVKQEHDSDKELVLSLLDTMEATGADFTNTFRALSRIPIPGAGSGENDKRDVIGDIVANCVTPSELARALKPSISRENLVKLLQLGEESSDMLEMYTGKPYAYFKKQMEDLEASEKMRLRDPCAKSKDDFAKWSDWVNTYEKRLAQECSAIDAAATNAERAEVMNNTNPKFILRNYLAQNAIQKAEDGNYSELRKLFKVMLDPYGKTTGSEEEHYADKPPSWSVEICVSCSS